MGKPNWDDYFLNIVQAVATRAGCNRGQSGAVIVKDNRILSTGYVGAPAGLPDCYSAGHLLRTVIYQDGTQKQHCQRTIHAEANAILYAAKYGVAINQATMYCSMVPCINCANSIAAVGITKVVAQADYQASQSTKSLFNQLNIQLIIKNPTPPTY